MFTTSSIPVQAGRSALAAYLRASCAELVARGRAAGSLHQPTKLEPLSSLPSVKERRGKLGPDKAPYPPTGRLADTADPAASDTLEPHGGGLQRPRFRGGDARRAECPPWPDLMQPEGDRTLDPADADGRCRA